ncbi:energy transducer TonB [Flavobacterium sp. W21_SRS_FM6]|uniref:energy transducer TonB n=1 Tax=Flavobacterium sp. W21_SRS_FM6 TaxID=3240268 RepID=UPI003F93883F
MKKILTFCSTLLLSTTTYAQNFADVQLTQLSPIQDESIWLREKPVTPMYPIELATKGVVGCGVFKVTIDKDGNTDNVTLVSAVPQKHIAKPASKVIKSWKWTNAEDRIAAPEEKILRLDFCMGGETREEAETRCFAQSQLACKE